jgi:hypothetical protein
MRQRGMIFAIGLVLLVNAVVLGGAAYNRSGEPDATVTLTEREMPLVSGYGRSENSGVSFRIRTDHYGYWRRHQAADIAFAWLDRAKLESLGFDVKTPITGAEAYDHYSRMLPRRIFSVLEYEGTVWEQWRARVEQELIDLKRTAPGPLLSAQELVSARKDHERELRNGSRLFIIDAGNDAGELRRLYPDRGRFLILPAKVHIFASGGHAGPDGKIVEAGLRGSIELLITEVVVPRGLQVNLDARRATGPLVSVDPYPGDHEPRYEVVLRSGKRYEPWIADIRPLAR